MEVVIPGGSGQVGTLLARDLHAKGHDAVSLSRRVQARPWEVVPCDATTLGSWAAAFDGSDVVITLAGRNLNCRAQT